MNCDVELFFGLVFLLCRGLLNRNCSEVFVLKLVLFVFMEIFEMFLLLCLLDWVFVKRILSDDLLLVFDCFVGIKILSEVLLFKFVLLFFDEFFCFRIVFFVVLLNDGLFFLSKVCREEICLFCFDLLLCFIFLINI